MKNKLAFAPALIACAIAATAVSYSSAQNIPAAPATTVATSESAMPVVGSQAPTFALLDQDGKTRNLSDFKGKTVVLAFYPADMTSGCSLEARNLTAALPQFEKRNIQVLGISTQGVDSKKQFCDKEGIKYPLLADTEKQATRAYGVLAANGNVARRVTFVIAPDGKVAAVESRVKVGTHAEDVLKTIDNLARPTAPSAAAQQHFAQEAAAQNAVKVALGQPVAAIDLPDATGKATTVGDWGGAKATVIFFVATKCPVSNAYNARMAKLAADYSDKGVRFYGINSNKAELSPEIVTHAKKNNLTFPILKDTGNVVADRFTAGVTPEAYVVNDKGVLTYWGHIDDSQDEAGITQRGLKDALDATLAGKPIAAARTKAFGCSIKR
jgi:peroxiredoxin Q/BCP